MNTDEQKYWGDFYNNSAYNVDHGSNFCNFVMNYFEDNKDIVNVLDCGCGNGRDSYVLSSKYNVDGVDSCGFIPSDKQNIHFSCSDFVTMDKNQYDLMYSRFTFHSITDEQHLLFLDSIQANTYLAIETRSDKSEAGFVYHGKDHFRNYTNVDYLKKILAEHNFEIMFIEEGLDMAKYKNENPICIRVICKKTAINSKDPASTAMEVIVYN